MCILRSPESEAAGLSARKPNTAHIEKWKGGEKKKEKKITVSKTVGIADVAAG